MCIQCNIDDKWPPFIEFMAWFILMGLNVCNHFGAWSVTQTHVIDISQSKYCNATYTIVYPTTAPPPNSSVIDNSEFIDKFGVENAIALKNDETSVKLTQQLVENITLVGEKMLICINSPRDLKLVNPLDENTTFFQHLISTPEEQWKDLILFRHIYIAICAFGLFILLLHVAALMPNIIQHHRVNPALLKESENPYFQSILKIHCGFLFFETILFDVPIGCCTMEMLALIWSNSNSTVTEMQKMEASKMVLALSIIGLSFFALYKGMMPIFLWLGNPFCFPCIPLRLLVVFPGGLISLVMSLAPTMYIAKNRLIAVAPAEYMQAEIGNLAGTFVSIGTIFWVLFLVGFVLIAGSWYKFCRPGATGDCKSICS